MKVTVSDGFVVVVVVVVVVEGLMEKVVFLYHERYTPSKPKQLNSQELNIGEGDLQVDFHFVMRMLMRRNFVDFHLWPW